MSMDLYYFTERVREIDRERVNEPSYEKDMASDIIIDMII